MKKKKKKENKFRALSGTNRQGETAGTINSSESLPSIFNSLRLRNDVNVRRAGARCVQLCLSLLSIRARRAHITQQSIVSINKID